MSATRRGLLGGAASLAVAPLAASAAASAQPHPDAELLCLSDRFIANERAIQAEPCDAGADTPEEAQGMRRMRGMVGVQHALSVQMGTLRATTADGIQARAYCLALHNADGAFSMDDPDTTTGRLLRYLMRDAQAFGGVRPVVSPDADLLAACAAFDELERAYIGCGGDWESGSPEELAAEAEQDRLSIEQGPLVNRICEMRAVTKEGHVARARSLALWDAELLKDGPGDTGACLTAAIVRDLLAGSAVA